MAAPLRVAVAANFAVPAKSLAASFTQQTGQPVDLLIGATGKLYAQISNGAPFDVLLSADAATPLRLEQEGRTLAGSRFTYALGRLALWSAKPDFVDSKGDVLQAGQFNKLAIAAPKLAPYGDAAMQTLNALGLQARLEPKIVIGESVGQAFSFVSTGNADLGFVALAQVLVQGKLVAGSAWFVPASLHAPLRQDAVILSRSTEQKGARLFLKHLQSQSSQALIRGFGYDLPP